MKRKICNHPGCNCLIVPPERYCSKHQRERPQPFETAKRFNELLYNTTRWRKLRTKILKEQTHCSKCGLSNSETKLEVHHVIPPRGNEELFFDENNLVAVCPLCHKIITGREIRNRKIK
jgi:5-methylcytosine-specific restriction protein A